MLFLIPFHILPIIYDIGLLLKHFFLLLCVIFTVNFSSLYRLDLTVLAGFSPDQYQTTENQIKLGEKIKKYRESTFVEGQLKQTVSKSIANQD